MKPHQHGAMEIMCRPPTASGRPAHVLSECDSSQITAINKHKLGSRH